MITHLKGVSDSLTSFQRRLFDQLRTNPPQKTQAKELEEDVSYRNYMSIEIR